MKKILFFLLACAIFPLKDLRSDEPSQKISDPFVMVIFGATGDLTARKLLPATYQLSASGSLPEEMAFIGVGRRDYTDDFFRSEMKKAALTFSQKKTLNEAHWGQFEKRVFYQKSDFSEDAGYEDLKKRLQEIDQRLGTKGNRIFYLATKPEFFSTIVEKLSQHGLLAKNKKTWTRVIIEKPFGKDLESAFELQEKISKHLSEDQIYRIDHYLGKEGVQNLFALRFEKGFFEPVWNREYIDNVQITLSEEIGIGSRGSFWEETGLIRDLFQNHLMQLLTIVAMDAPKALTPAEIHAKKIELLEKIRPLATDDMILGQYDKGSVQGKEVLGYLDEKDVPKTSRVETFAAAKFFIDNERWQGVPFYIRAGKRMPQQTAEVCIQFKEGAFSKGKALFIRIQPNAGVFLKTSLKDAHKPESVHPVGIDTSIHKASPEAYERLIYDCIRGDKSLFVEADEQIASWRLFTPVLNYWKEHPPEEFPNYKAGSWGPSDADALLLEDGRSWQILKNQ